MIKKYGQRNEHTSYTHFHTLIPPPSPAYSSYKYNIVLIAIHNQINTYLSEIFVQRKLLFLFTFLLSKLLVLDPKFSSICKGKSVEEESSHFRTTMNRNAFNNIPLRINLAREIYSMLIIISLL